MINKLIYHENNSKYPYIPQEDAFADAGSIFVVADGVTHDASQDGMYPIPSDSAKVAQIVCDSVIDYLKDKKPSLDNIKQAYIEANTKVQHFNENRPLYINRENNGYTVGAATTATLWFDNDTLLYGVIDDCFISVFSDDYVGHPMLKSFIEQSSKFLDANYDWLKPETRKLWRKDIRNNVYVKDGKEYGYGVIDGRDGFLPYLQLGEVKLKKGYLVCLYTDGFTKMLQDTDFVRGLREQPFSMETYEYIKGYTEKLDTFKEKTGYFIKH